MSRGLNLPQHTDQTMTVINFATATATELEAAGYSIKTLKIRKARKNETHFTSGKTQGGGQVNPNLTMTDGNIKGQASTGGRWVGAQCGIGKEMVRNLNKVKRNYNETAKVTRRQAAIDRLNG